MKATSHLFVVCLVVLLATGSSSAEQRIFTSTAGSTIQGKLLTVKGGQVTIKKADGQVLTLNVSAFSRADQAWLQAQASPAGASGIIATKEVPYVNSLGMKFVPVPGTEVLFCTTLTRCLDFNAFEVETSKAKPLPAIAEYDFQNPKRENRLFPANALSWEKAKAFCDWLSQKEGKTYRLPTDREWSVAVGIGGLESKTALPSELDGKLKGMYPWGGQWPPPNGFGNYCDEAYKDFCDKGGHKGAPTIKGYKDGEIAISPVEAFKPNKFGLYDMGGNLWQWCEDWYDAGKSQKLLRGGSWDDSEKDRLLASTRWHNLPSFQETDTNRTSFRCVLLPSPEPAANAAATPAATGTTTGKSAASSPASQDGSLEVEIDSNSEGVPLGSLKVGQSIKLNYIEGTWSAYNDWPAESPDQAKISQHRLWVVCVTPLGKNNTVVPLNSRRQTYNHKVKEEGEYFLRIADPQLQSNSGKVKYRVLITAPKP